MSGPRIVRDRGRYLAATLERLVADVAQAGEGSRNRTLNRAAFAWSRMGGDETGLERLGAAGLAVGLDEGEVAATLASARRGGAAAPLALLEGGGGRTAAPERAGRQVELPARRPTPCRFLPVPAGSCTTGRTDRTRALGDPAGSAGSAGSYPSMHARTREDDLEREAIQAEGRMVVRPGMVGPVGRCYGSDLPPLHAEALVLEAARLLAVELPGEGGW